MALSLHSIPEDDRRLESAVAAQTGIRPERLAYAVIAFDRLAEGPGIVLRMYMNSSRPEEGSVLLRMALAELESGLVRRN